MTYEYDLRLRAYEPLGPRLGVLPYPTKIVFTPAANEIAVLDLWYPLDAPGHEWVQDQKEIRVEWTKDKGQSWSEAFDGACLQYGRSRDRLDKTEMVVYHYLGIGVLEQQSPRPDPSPTTPGRRAGKPVRRFPNAHDDPPATFGDVSVPLWTEARNAEIPWGETFAGDDVNKLDRGYSEALDSNGDPYVGGLSFDMPIQESLAITHSRFIDADLVDTRWLGHTKQVVNKGGFARDFTADPGYLLIRDGDGVTAAPQDIDYSRMCSSVTIFGAYGLWWRFVNDEAEPEYGGREDSIDAGDVYLTEVAQQIANAYLRAGQVKREMHTREVDFGRSSIRPLAEARIFDLIAWQRGRNQDDEQINPTETGMIHGFSITREKRKGLTGHWILGDRITDRSDALLRHAVRLADGAKEWSTKPVEPPGGGVVPLAPTNVVVTKAEYKNQAQHTRVRFSITFDFVTQGTDPDTGVIGDVEIQQYRIERRAGAGLWRDIGGVPSDATLPYEDDDRPPGQTFTYRVRAISWDGVPSEPSGTGADTGTDAVDPRARSSLVIDAGHQDYLRNAARVAATTGLSFVVEGTDVVAAMTGTSTITKYGVASADSAAGDRFRVLAGETHYAEGWFKRVGFSVATVRVQVFYAYDDGTTGLQSAALSGALGTTYSLVGGTTSASKDGYAEVRATPDGVTGTGTVRGYKMYATKQSDTKDIKVGAITADLINVGTLNGVHITGLIIDAGQLNASAISAGTMDSTAITAVTIAGAVITGGKLTTGTGNIVIDNDSISVGSNVISFSGSLVTFSAGIAVAGSAQVSSTLAVTGTTTLTGQLNANGGIATANFGANGTSPQGKATLGGAVSGAVGPWQIAAQALINNLRTMSINNGTGQT